MRSDKGPARLRTWLRRRESLLLPLLAALLLLAGWTASVVYTGTSVFPLPSDVFLGLVQLLDRGLLWSYILDSLWRVGAGYVTAVCLGIPLGILLGWYPLLAAAANPLIQALRPISPLAWMPLAVIWFGVGDLSPIFLIFLGAFFPVLISTMNGVRDVPAIYLQAGKNFGLSPLRLMVFVVFPSVLPQILTGCRIALGIAWLVLVAAEMIAVDSGLGYLIIDARNAGMRYDLVVAGMFLIGVIGLILDVLVRQTERLRAVRWGFRPEE